jgi:hypothetical protein
LARCKRTRGSRRARCRCGNVGMTPSCCGRDSHLSASTKILHQLLPRLARTQLALEACPVNLSFGAPVERELDSRRLLARTVVPVGFSVYSATAKTLYGHQETRVWRADARTSCPCAVRNTCSVAAAAAVQRVGRTAALRPRVCYLVPRFPAHIADDAATTRLPSLHFNIPTEADPHAAVSQSASRSHGS